MKFAFTDLSRDEGDKLIFGWKPLFVTLWREIFALIRANLCFILFCIPLVTIPAAIVALHGVCVDAIRGKQCKVFKTFWETVRRQFLQSWGAFLALGIFVFLGAFGGWFYFSKAAEFMPFGILGLFMTAVAVVTVMMIPYCCCMIARVKLSLKNALKNAFLVAMLNLKFSICSTVLCSALLLVQFLFWLYVIPLSLLCGFALAAFLSSYFSLYGLQEYVLNENL